MTSNIEFRRTHDGKLGMFVSGIPALNANVTQFGMVDGNLHAVVTVPLKEATIGEADVVIPFERPAHRTGGNAS